MKSRLEKKQLISYATYNRFDSLSKQRIEAASEEVVNHGAFKFSLMLQESVQNCEMSNNILGPLRKCQHGPS